MNKFIATVVACCLFFSMMGCSKTVESQTDETISTSSMFTERDMEIEYDEADYQEIVLKNESITISEAGLYILKGDIADGQIIIDVSKSEKVQLILDNVNINCSNSAAIYVKSADKVFITLANESENTLSVSNEYEVDDNNVDSVIFSKEDLTINGNGKLIINADYGHGIVSKDDLAITSGEYVITAQNHGISANDSVRIADGNFNITSGKDAIKAENITDETLGFVYIANGNFEINSGLDGISASGTQQIEDGNFNIITGGGSVNGSEHSENEDFMQRPDQGDMQNIPEGEPMQKPNGDKLPENFDGEMTQNPDQTENSSEEEASNSSEEEATTSTSQKGLKAGGNLTINNGNFNIDSSDDVIHSNANVYINGGDFNLASGDDTIHADAQVLIIDGNINITKSYEAIEGQNIEIQGGTIRLTSSDDGLNSSGGADQSGLGGRGMDSFAVDEECYIKITGGKIYINANGDGVDSNGNITITGGETYVSGPVNNANVALDYNGEAQITGGTFIAVGPSGMAQNFSDSSTQGAILISTQSAQSTNSAITLKDASGNTLLTYTPEKEYSSVLLSSPEIQKGETYTITIGTETKEVVMTDIIYGSSQGVFNGGR
ncbi:MAG: carbohydrate-binding domain-containing protein [Anaerorhabdus sp.]